MEQKTFLIVNDFWAWIPHNVEGKPHKDRYGKIWINKLNEDKITVTDPRGETSLKKREENDESRKFVTFTKRNGREKYEFIGIFQYVSRKGNKFIYERTYK